MRVEYTAPVVVYTSEAGDWQIVVEPLGAVEIRLTIVPYATGGLEYGSGINLDNLETLIAAARADAISRGINWSGN